MPFTSVDGTSFSGTLETQVYTADPFNPNGAGALTFVWHLHNNGPDPLEQLTTVNFQGYLVDAAFNQASVFGPGSVPFAVTRNSTGKILGWQFDPSGASNLPPGGNSTLMVAFTNATQFVPAQDSLINGSVATVASFGPVVPEPATIGLSALAAASLLGVRSRRTR